MSRPYGARFLPVKGGRESCGAILGVVLIALGVLFITLGLAAAAREVFRRATAPATRGLPIDPEARETLLRALTQLIKVAPQWFLLTLVGAGPVALGGTML